MKHISSIFFVLLTGIWVMACEASDEDYAWLLTLPAASGADASEEIPVAIDINDVNGDGEFVFNATREIELYIVVVDPVGPVLGSEIRIFEIIGGNQILDEVRFRAATDANGNVQGSITVNRSSNRILIEADYAGRTIRAEAVITYVDQINRTLNILLSMAPVIEPDTDGDGIIDRHDHFPEDATRATTVRYPTQGYYTIAFEDLYPQQGDADFNDYVVRAVYEEDLNAAGQLVRLRGQMQHIARGAGYKHTLRLTLPGMHGSYLHLQRFKPSGETIATQSYTVDNFKDIEIMPRSDQTLTRSNTQPGQSMLPGQRIAFEVIANGGINRNLLGNLPYDLHLHVLNTNHDIHFAGRYHDENGNDTFLDAQGFPWALLVPGDFAWPYERHNIHQAYEFFDDWYLSAGTESHDWPLHATASEVFPVNTASFP